MQVHQQVLTSEAQHTVKQMLLPLYNHSEISISSASAPQCHLNFWEFECKHMQHLQHKPKRKKKKTFLLIYIYKSHISNFKLVKYVLQNFLYQFIKQNRCYHLKNFFFFMINKKIMLKKLKRHFLLLTFSIKLDSIRLESCVILQKNEAHLPCCSDEPGHLCTALQRSCRAGGHKGAHSHPAGHVTSHLQASAVRTNTFPFTLNSVPAELCSSEYG